ncbi:uncharacterized protein EAF01_008390 [Botrytis porri]|uniref:SPT2 chromatin protein n=1 Tax=Botrytis porri TaxID=87229 RepID=A0A4Z1L6X3_9HELO|nr:uncharacterized protein EAF01_008390 [Botrytis porri]KAF7899177.1 hypothetical protein EAF01_008390 [Botrytis porri]TGO92253.1 hypothetical protein BPOR_0007g00370 [Botrytis porri]
MPIGDLLAQISGGPSPDSTMTMPTATLPPKRKANDDLRKPVDKLQRPNTATISRPIIQAHRPTAVDTNMGRMKIDTKDTKQQRPTPSSANTANTTFKNGQPTPPPSSTESSKPPKKGSYAEILARGKAAQASLGQVGKIQHKRIEKAPSKRESDKLRTQKGKTIQKGLEPNSKFQRPGQVPVRNGQSGTNGTKSVGAKAPPPAVEKKVKKAATATTGYTGTARPRPGGGGPTANKPSAPSYSARSSNDRYKNGRKNLDRYYATDEDEDEDDMEGEVEEDDYASDVSSDMEAATFEVDEEEEMAAAIARKEDAEALAEENRLKKEKAEKRARLAAMAKSRR